ncbi:hypothetical protein COC42_01810 [Sphingomonas spermidinifaciens]|uniref:Secreted protein n=1 Tax=Sphingomonas spermidinifaciens TaxID=1141889 RepID=A0A2A4B5F3_9SPHN|nr:hypothetical protein [Sphingomonas spermidinifaciens]PCD03182.1 hypothetical protein COC42_01810 [Sphingomonas spermidinifaciens]
MRRLTLGLLLLPLLATPALSLAQEARQGGTPNRIRNIMLKQGEKCPEATGDEVVVCGRIDPEEQYRIPKEFRDQPVVAGNQSWTNRAQTMMEVNRAGLPNSCSPVGTGGQTGCNQQMIDQWFEWRRAQRAEAAKLP